LSSWSLKNLTNDVSFLSRHAVPFGLLGDEMVRPEAVPTGKACGCICPECQGSLVAKNAGLKVRPHFAHMAGMGSDLCGETAVHLMAKQILARARQVMLPEWQRQHSERDISGQPHHCVETRSARQWSYAIAKEEVWHHGIRPDVFLSDAGAAASLPLLVEVRVSHAVDQFKARLVRERGWAMVEIDLSKAPEDALAPDWFEEFVLSLAPRKWIHAPKAERRFAEKRKALRELVAKVNDELRRKGVEEVDEFGRMKSDLLRQQRIDTLRSERRKVFVADIKALESKTLPNSLRQLEAERREKDAEAMEVLLVRHSGQLPSFAKLAHKDAWVVNVSTARWQLAVAERFIYRASEGTRVSTGVVSRWVADTFGIDEDAGRLIDAQRKDRERRKRRGDSRIDLIRHAWFFDDAENRLIPNLFHAVDALMAQLVAAELLLISERWTYVVDGPRGKDERQLAEEGRAAALAEKQRQEAQVEQERQRAASIDRKTFEEQRHRRIEGLILVYETLAKDLEQCLDCLDCRWPSAPEVGKCANCGSTNALLIRLDAQRIREVPHRLRSDASVMRCSKYPFE
jgi:hypothetical protein